MMRRRITGGVLALLTFLAVRTITASPVLTTIADFTGANGALAPGGLVADGSGNFLGVTLNGGPANTGVLFQIDGTTHALTTLTTLATLGAGSNSQLVPDGLGNFYGSSAGGGTGAGVVFQFSQPTHTLSTIASFNGANGRNPQTSLVADAAGNLYGVTYSGGANNFGTVFKVAAGTRQLTTLATFNGANGANPYGGLAIDAAGNLYGTTLDGGASDNGTLFMVRADTGALNTLVVFNGLNGRAPRSNLIFDGSGNLYGTASMGGGGYGTVFEVAADTHALTTLASFAGAASHGASPLGGLLLDAKGNLFGTTANGGPTDAGSIFEIDGITRSLTTLAFFSGSNSTGPAADLIADGSGNLYGTTLLGGARNQGTAFELTGSGFAVPLPPALAPALITVLAWAAASRRRIGRWAVSAQS